jgi:hypothetical protein
MLQLAGTAGVITQLGTSRSSVNEMTFNPSGRVSRNHLGIWDSENYHESSENESGNLSRLMPLWQFKRQPGVATLLC